jgi:uncharacterized membrane protein (UPF0127 family)
MGLMFSKELKHDHGLIIVENNESRINTAIHSPKKPAQYVVELHESKFSEYSIGDKLILFNEN